MFARLHLHNPDPATRILILEPWANEFSLEPHERCIVEGDGPPHPNPFEVVEEADILTVWAWSGADARLLTKSGVVLADWTGLRIPPIPGSLPAPPAWTPRPLGHEDLSHWLSGGAIDGVELSVNQTVELTEGTTSGRLGAVISPESIDGTLRYRVELSDGTDVVVPANYLAAYYEWPVAV